MVHCPSLKTNKAELRMVTDTGSMDKTPLKFSRDKPMSTKGWFNVSCDVLEYTAMGGGEYNLLVKSFSLSNRGTLFLQE